MDILAAFIGGLLAAGTGWFLDRQRERSKFKKLRGLIETAIKDDLEHSVNIYEKIEEEWEKAKKVYFSTLNEFEISRLVIDKHRDQLVLIEDDVLRKKISKHHYKSSELIFSLRYAEQKVLDLDNTHRKLSWELWRTQPNLSENDVVKQTNARLATEIEEANYFRDTIPQKVSKIYEIKNTAKELLQTLNK